MLLCAGPRVKISLGLGRSAYKRGGGGICCATRRVGMAPRVSASSAAFGLAEEGNAKARRVHSDRV